MSVLQKLTALLITASLSAAAAAPVANARAPLARSAGLDTAVPGVVAGVPVAGSADLDIAAPGAGARLPVARSVDLDAAVPGGARVPVARGADLDTGALDALVERRSRAAHVPGVSYAVVGLDGVQHKKSFGTDGEGRAVTERTPFVWGSVSKPVTASLVTLLVRDGLLRLDAPVTDLLPAFAGSRITVRQLLDHTSGLPRGLEVTDRYDDGRSLTTVVPRIAELDPVAAPGEKHSYSSLNYIVLGAVVESVTRKPFAEALTQRLLTPAGMRTTTADASRAEQTVPPGHRYVAGRARAFDTRVDPATVPAGYLVGSVEDLAAFARTQLPGGSVLGDGQRRLLHTAEANDYALGWRTSKLAGTDEPMIWHGGAAPGYQSAILLLPDRNQAVVMLQNAYSPFLDERLLDTAWGVAGLLTGTEPATHGTDPTYPILVAALALITLLLLAAAVLTVIRLIRGPRRRRSRQRRLVGLVVSLVGLGAIVFALFSLPGLAGVTLDQLVLWAPDLSWLTYAGLVMCGVVAVLRVIATLRPDQRALRRSQSSG